MAFSTVTAIAFDLDGTLIDSVPDLAAATNALLVELGFDTCSEDDVRSWVGNGAKKLVERALTAKATQVTDEQYLLQVMPRFMQHYQYNLQQHSRLYSGVGEVLAELKQAGFRLAVVTNKPYQFTVPLLKAFALDALFDVVLGGDSLQKMKPDPMPLNHLLDHWQLSTEALLMVGDSKNDIFAAKSAGISVIGLTYGYNYGEDISLSGPNAVCEQFSEILAHVSHRPNEME
ncbi:phosphoglycolate phosphatase [Shewanella waksmanii]|uniref:phosphoglycolate phosphatase n=1 Tax=Shewanella waksmanii TaxID=213783 RepID=UPI00048B19B0|nr:phosphoglycolate phosphatase [Shewanella waksmanii]